jgi:hypothetical protein
MKLYNRYALLACLVCAVVIVICARLRIHELGEALVGALFLLVPVVLASVLVTAIQGDPLEDRNKK